MSLAENTPDVLSASPILYTTSIMKMAEVDVLSYIIGFDPDEPLGGPAEVVEGTAVITHDEVIIDEAVARSQKLALGNEAEIMGQSFTIVGLTKGM
jgi:hypothetical protein